MPRITAAIIFLCLSLPFCPAHLPAQLHGDEAVARPLRVEEAADR